MAPRHRPRLGEVVGGVRLEAGEALSRRGVPPSKVDRCAPPGRLAEASMLAIGGPPEGGRGAMGCRGEASRMGRAGVAESPPRARQEPTKSAPRTAMGIKAAMPVRPRC